jgi:NAD(P)-dependent dehydrogenase (short-subunit alcohol dehydrogenase family)
MSSYVVTGASRGIGVRDPCLPFPHNQANNDQYEFITQLSQDESNIVIGLVRNKATTDERLAKDGIKNVTIIEADITSFAAQQKAAIETGQLTGGSLDYLINNAALANPQSGIMDLGELYFLGVYL